MEPNTMRTMRWRAAAAAMVITLLAGTAGAAPALIDAVKAADGEAVRALLRSGVDVDEREADGSTALHWAVRNGDQAILALLLEAGAAAGAANRYGVTPLSLAATFGDAAAAERLLQAGASANAALPEGETVLMTAARAGSVDVVRLLLVHGADVHATESWQGQNALMWAAAENHGAVVRLLVEAGADMNARSTELEGMPPLRRTAPDKGQQGIHTTFPRGGMTPLLFAARQNAADAVTALAELGVDLDQKDPDGFTAVILAILNGHYDLAALLIEKGAGVDVADSSGRTPLYAAVDQNTFEYSFNRPNPKPSGRMDPVDLVRFLLARGANPNARLTDRVKAAKYDTAGNPNLIAGATPLMKAASTADVTLLRILLEAGADPFIRNSAYSNALHVAAGLNWRRLGGIGPEPDAIETLKVLLDAGLDIHSYNGLGQTVLHAAAMRGRGGQEEGPNTVESENLIRFLLSRGARLDVKDKAGRTPLDMALFTRNEEAARLYREAERPLAAR